MAIDTQASESAEASEKTAIGNYFVSNYPPFSRWKPELAPAALEALNAEPRPEDPLGLYIHIPFCRKRCKFCYFKVYTDKNAEQIEKYLGALVKEMEIYSRQPALQGRTLRFTYFGGGTPSYLSEKQLHRLVEGLALPLESDLDLELGQRRQMLLGESQRDVELLPVIVVGGEDGIVHACGPRQQGQDWQPPSERCHHL